MADGYDNGMRWAECLVKKYLGAKSPLHGHDSTMIWAECLLAECSVTGLQANVYDDSWDGLELVQQKDSNICCKHASI